jgi:hypothetical protein
MRVVVLAHPRSGTAYTAACFRRAGWDVGHEWLGTDGIASWMWAVQSAHVPWGVPRLETLVADVVLHVMREPAAAVSSIAYTEHQSEPWRARWVDIPEDAGSIERAVWSYYGWNRLIARQRPTHTAQLEQIETAVTAITGRAFDALTAYRNQRHHPSHSADEIKATVWEHPLTATLWDHTNAIYQEAAL